ncbi:class I SAM-dependent methyltransferase [bacterium]|nr:class I SAM-dependent methyltransferase [bacterium]
MQPEWIAYNELAWTEDLLAGPEDCEDEVQFYIDRILSASEKPPVTLLHLGSGAGNHDTFFKELFKVTGVDISPGMVDKARVLHPDIEYVLADMRTVRLNRLFDAVAVPDSIDYMATEDDLRQAIRTAAEHLRPGGVLLVAAKPAETFRDNNFAYVGEKDDVHVTVLENNYINPYRPDTYEATIAYLIRRKGELTVHTERHMLGLFPLSVWEKIFLDEGLTMSTTTLSGAYDRYLLNDGEYPITVFSGIKT